MIISLCIILPNTLRPIYEENIYNYLKQPLSMVKDDISSENIDTEIAYIYIVNNQNILASDNLSSVINISNINKLISKITSDYGKFTYKRTTYYYNTSNNDDVVKIAITNDSYINKLKKEMYQNIFAVVILAFTIISLILVFWSNNLVKRIKKLKGKIENLNNDDYDHKLNNNLDDELHTLDVAIENMRLYLKTQEEYKNQMYQNISHDFKTPITVIKSYLEATEDGMETPENTLAITKEQIEKLEIKVHSLLYLNKLNYIKDRQDNLNETYDVSQCIYAAVEKFQMSRPDVEFEVVIDKKSTIFRGTFNMWEAIIDNILNNFTRYAKKKIKITVKNKKIILYNDGENINENVLDNIFTPYEKGVKGVFGLGLSIVKKTLHLLNYDITVENVKDGVKFTIYE
jgi:two-component system sensor histidine kinase CssS